MRKKLKKCGIWARTDRCGLQLAIKKWPYGVLQLVPAGPGFREKFLENKARSCQQKIAIWACRSVTRTDLGEKIFRKM